MDSEPELGDSGEAATKERKPLTTGPKRQHFLPRFYLEGFTKNGFLAVYDREVDRIRAQQPVNTGIIGHFYTMEDTEGRRRFELEQLLSEFEGKASVVIRKLEAAAEITAEERADFAIFIALAAFRTPDMVDSVKALNSSLIKDAALQLFRDVEEVKAQMRGKPYAPPTEEELEADARELVEYAQSGQYEVKTSHRWSVGMSIRIAFRVAPILAGRDWVVLHRTSDKTSFVTTDAPVLLTTVVPREDKFWGIGFGDIDALVVFPMTLSSVLLIFGGGSGALVHRTAGRDQIRHTNLALAGACQRFVIGRDEALLRSLADRLGLARKKWQPKMRRIG